MEKKVIGWCIIPPNIIAREDITASEKILYGRIVGLADNKGYCYASNQWLGEQTGLNKRTISNLVTDLQKKKLIKVVVDRTNNNEVLERKIYPLELLSEAQNPLPSTLSSVDPSPLNNVDPSTLKTVYPSTLKLLHSNRDTSETDLSISSNEDIETEVSESHLKKKKVTPRSLGITTVFGGKRKLLRKNPNVDAVIFYLKKSMGVPVLDGSIKQNREYAHLLLVKFKSLESVQKIIDAGVANKFWGTKITSCRQVYQRAVELISDTRNPTGRTIQLVE